MTQKQKIRETEIQRSDIVSFIKQVDDQHQITQGTFKPNFIYKDLDPFFNNTVKRMMTSKYNDMKFIVESDLLRHETSQVQLERDRVLQVINVLVANAVQVNRFKN